MAEVESAESARSSVPGPLTMYVAWHPKCPDGESLARGVYHWFRKPSRAVQQAGSGIPVYYRSQPWGDTPPVDGEKPAFLRGISLADAEINVVIPIIDEYMVDSRPWRTWLYDMASRHVEYDRACHRARLGQEAAPDSGVVLIPVQLHHSIAQLDPLVSGINAIRLDNWDDRDDGDDSRRKRRSRRMRRYLVQTLVRTLREQREDQRDDLLPRSVFLSHAKGDQEFGVGIAEKIRTKALASGQIDTFFDASQLEWGKRWLKSMTSAADERTAAFIAVFSDLYSTRYWCREEIRRARKPRTLDEIEKIRALRLQRGDDSGARSEKNGAAKGEPPAQRGPRVKERIWWVQPIVIVDALNADWTYVLPEMSGAPVVRWETEDDAAEILDRVMLEALRSEVQVRHASLLASRRTAQLGELHFLTWVPDPHTLLEWAFGEPEVGAETKAERTLPKGIVVYPGHGLGQLDERQLNRYLGHQVTFQSIEEMANSPDPMRDQEAAAEEEERKREERRASLTPVDELPLVALSVGDPDLDELSALGYGSEHLDDAVYRLVAALLAANCRIAYGGVIRSTKGFLESVVDAVVMVSRERQARRDESKEYEEEDGARPQPPTMLHSFQAWDFYRFTNKEKRAELHGLTTFHDIEPPNSALEQDLPRAERRAESDLECMSPRPDSKNLPRTLVALYRARALTRMRLRVSERSAALLAIGGKTYGWSGFAPGVLEEICLTHGAGGHVFLLPEFGGASRAMASWLLDEKPTKPFDLLRFDHHAYAKGPRNPKLAEIIVGLQREGEDVGQEQAEKILRSYYDYLHGLADTLRLDLLTFLGRESGGSQKSTWGGLDKDRLMKLMTTGSMGLVRHLLVQFVLPHLRQNPTGAQADR